MHLSACQADQLTVGDAERSAEGRGTVDRARNGDVFMRDGGVFPPRAISVIHGLHVVDDASHRDGKRTGSDHASRRLVNGDHLVSRGIDLGEKADPYPGEMPKTCIERLDRLTVGRLDRNDHAISLKRCGDLLQHHQDLLGVTRQELTVQLEQGLAFRTVQDHGVRGHIQFCIGRKACSAGANDARVPQKLC